MKTQLFKSILFITFSLALAISFSSCDKRIRKKGSGVVVTNTRSVSDFSKLNAEGSYNLHTYNSDQSYIEITTDDNIMSEVQTFVQDGELTIEMNDDYLTYKPTQMTIKVYGNMLGNISLNGDAELTMNDTCTLNNFSFSLNGSGRGALLVASSNSSLKVNGSGNVSCAGVSTHTEIEVNGSGKAEALGLTSLSVDATVKGIGKIYTYCLNNLNARIEGSGDIYYSGSPLVSTNISGSGSVTHY